MISALTYANRLIYTEKGGDKYGSVLRYNDAEGVNKFSFANFKRFTIEPNGIESTIKLFENEDGSKIEMIYTYTQVGDVDYIVFNFTARFNIYDKNGIIQFVGSGVQLSKTVNANTMQVKPFSELYYVASDIWYFQGVTPTVVNDQARSTAVAGSIFYKAEIPPAGGYIDFQENRAYSYDSFVRSFPYLASTIKTVTSDTDFNNYFGIVDPDNEWHDTSENVPQDPDPSQPGGGDRPEGGDGDSVDFPDIPTVDILGTGLITMYNPDNTSLRNLAIKLWSNDFAETIAKILNNPFDGLINLSMIPFTPNTAGSESCMIGNYDTQINMTLVSSQYKTLDCGSVVVGENWHNALDYNATNIEIFVPFVGFKPLYIDDVMGKTIQLKYNIDLLSGSGVAILKCGNKCLYEWPCNVSYDVPLTGSNKAALYTGLINIATSGLHGAAVGGAMGAVGGAATSAINLGTSKQSDIERSGSLAACVGELGEFTPYIVIHRPVQSMPKDFKKIKGYQSNITSQLSSLAGYTEIEYIHLTGIKATDSELEEIETLLKEGVII